MMSTAARFGSSSSFVSGWSTLENVATAETARVSSRAYGAAAWARCCALMIRDAAMSSMARVIFFIDSVDLIRARYSRSDTAISDHHRGWRDGSRGPGVCHARRTREEGWAPFDRGQRSEARAWAAGAARHSRWWSL